MPGYSISEGVFQPAEMDAVLAGLAGAILVRTRRGVRHVLRLPVVRDLASDPRLLDLARSFVGASPIPFRATLFDKSDASNWLVAWHQDRALPLRGRSSDPHWGPWSMKAGVLHAHAPASVLESVIALRVHLDDSTPTNGPLRVLPGTHDRGLLTDPAIKALARRILPVDCVAGAGAVVAMRPLIVHSSSKATDGHPRRVLHLEYASTLHVGLGIELAVC